MHSKAPFVLVLSLTLVACGGGRSPSSPAPGPTATPTPEPIVRLTIKSSLDSSEVAATVTIAGATPGTQTGSSLVFNDARVGVEMSASVPAFHTHQNIVRGLGDSLLLMVPNNNDLPGQFINEIFYTSALAGQLGVSKPLYKVTRREVVVVVAPAIRNPDTTAVVRRLVETLNSVTSGAPTIVTESDCTSDATRACVTIEEKPETSGFMTTFQTRSGNTITGGRIEVRDRNDIVTHEGVLLHELGHAVLGFDHLISFAGLMTPEWTSFISNAEFSDMEGAAYTAVSKARWPGCRFPDDCRQASVTAASTAEEKEEAVCSPDQISGSVRLQGQQPRRRPENNAMNLTNRGVPGMKERRPSGEPEHG